MIREGRDGPASGFAVDCFELFLALGGVVTWNDEGEPGSDKSFSVGRLLAAYQPSSSSSCLLLSSLELSDTKSMSLNYEPSWERLLAAYPPWTCSLTWA